MKKFEGTDKSHDFEAVVQSHSDDTVRWKFPRTSREAIRRMLTPDDFIEDSSDN